MDLIWLENTDLIDLSTLKAAGWNILIAEALIPIFFAFSIIYDMAKRAIGTVDGQKPNYFSKMEFLRLGSLMLMAGPLYIAFFWPLSIITTKIAKVTEVRYEQVMSSKEDVFKEFEGLDTTQPTAPEEELPWYDQLLEKAKQGVNIGVNALFMATTTPIIAMILAVISTVIKLFAIVMGKIFFVIGPLAIAFSMLPVFKDKMSSWFGVYLNCLFVPLTLNVLDYIYYSNIAEAFKGTEMINPVVHTCFNIVMIVCYCLAFWITSFYVGSPSAGKVLSTATTLATMAAGYAGKLGNAGGTAAGLAGGSSQLGNMLEDASSAARQTHQ
jgi:hypothetical protein